ncbi:MAG: helix-turn-helix domain-containing protein [Acidimicrobiales bacterium]
MASSTKAAKAELTRRGLVAAARELFGEHGYGPTSVDEIVRRAGVTKGALYHHFRDKDDLFRAVVEDVKRDVTDVVGAAFLTATAENETMESLVLGCQAFIDAHLDPAVQRISIMDARSVLDATTRRALDGRYEVAVIRGAFRRAMRLGAVEPQPLVPLAHMMAGALAEACAYIAEADDPSLARTEAHAVIVRLLDGLRARPPG